MDVEQEFRKVCYNAIDADDAFIKYINAWKRLSPEEQLKHNHIMPFIAKMIRIYDKLAFKLDNIDDLLTAFNEHTRPSQYSTGSQPKLMSKL